jgi:hypothetical protein
MIKYNEEDMRVYAEFIDDLWIASAFIDTDKNNRVVFSFAHGTDRDKAIREAAENGLARIRGDEQ